MYTRASIGTWQHGVIEAYEYMSATGKGRNAADLSGSGVLGSRKAFVNRCGDMTLRTFWRRGAGGAH